ncbi:unnamed protein product, partial [Phaeothamnion confervicola]
DEEGSDRDGGDGGPAAEGRVAALMRFARGGGKTGSKNKPEDRSESQQKKGKTGRRGAKRGSSGKNEDASDASEDGDDAVANGSAPGKKLRKRQDREAAAAAAEMLGLLGASIRGQADDAGGVDWTACFERYDPALSGHISLPDAGAAFASAGIPLQDADLETLHAKFG